MTSVNDGMLRHKVGASVVTVRRSAWVPVFDQLTNYVNYSEMLMPTSNYWNVAYGRTPNEVLQDDDGMQIMRVLGKNMSWLMKLVEFGRDSVEAPKRESKSFMSFIR